jgi:phosphoribosylaminoimidazole-succinocarboxamide synthase
VKGIRIMDSISEGKTKIIWPMSSSNRVAIETKDCLTAGDAAKREYIEGIATQKTAQTCNVFKMLDRAGIPTAFIMEETSRTFWAHKCEMLPLELVARRYAWGSYLKRDESVVSTKASPYRFSQIETEIFHKHAIITPPLVDAPIQLDEEEARRLYLRDGVWADGIYTDPLVIPHKDTWRLYSAKDPLYLEEWLMEIPAPLTLVEVDFLLEKILIPTFQTLEAAWAGIETTSGPVSLVDLKIEVGRRVCDGSLVVADVIDNDNWRIWPGANPTEQLDKQCFREGYCVDSVSENYAIVTSLTERFLEPEVREEA